MIKSIILFTAGVLIGFLGTWLNVKHYEKKERLRQFDEAVYRTRGEYERSRRQNF